MIKIAILGLGTVGTGVVKVVEANTVPIQHKLGQPLSVKTADKVLLQPDHQPNISDVKQSSLQKRQLLHVEGEAGKPDVAAVAEMYARRDFGGRL